MENTDNSILTPANLHINEKNDETLIKSSLFSSQPIKQKEKSEMSVDNLCNMDNNVEKAHNNVISHDESSGTRYDNNISDNQKSPMS